MVEGLGFRVASGRLPGRSVLYEDLSKISELRTVRTTVPRCAT